MPSPEPRPVVSNNVDGHGRLDNFVAPTARRLSSVKRTPRKRPVGEISTGSPLSRSSKIPTPAKKTKAELSSKVAKITPKIVCGLDFGTTYSGISYTWSSRLDRISVLMNLDKSNRDNEKVPSAIKCTNSASQQPSAWGNVAQRDPSSLKWFKLLLLKDDDLPADVLESEHIQKARALLKELDLTASDVISSYLKELWESGLEKIKIDASEATVANSRFHIVVTLPAIWPDYAKEGMRQAILEAGILKKRNSAGNPVLSFMSEPEAAALATLQRIEGRCDIEANDCFVVCDAGGGTVDIISYILNSSEPMEVREIVNGNGALCGVFFVDEQFLQLFQEKCVEVSTVSWNEIDPEELEDIMTTWRSQRNSFSGNSAESWVIRLPYSLIPPGHRGPLPRVTITPQDMEHVFHASVKRITKMVCEQVSAIETKQGKLPKYIILVGGYGRCPYLRYRLSEIFPDIGVLQSQGAEPWTAISRGAVIHGITSEKMNSQFSVGVRSRISRASYGVVCQEDFDDSKHLAEDKFWDDEQQSWKAKNQMKWLVRKGDDVKIGRRFYHDFFKIVNEEPGTLVTTIWMCKTWPPPDRKDESVTKHSEVTWDPKIDMTELPLVDAEHETSFRRLDFIAEMKSSGGSTEFGIFHDGKRQAVTSVSVEFHDHADI